MAEGGDPPLTTGDDSPLWLDWTDSLWALNFQEQDDEVTVLESIYADTDRFRVTGRPDDAQKGLFSFEMDIMVTVPDEGLTVEGWMLHDNSELEQDEKELKVEEKLKQGNTNCRPELQRTNSGHHVHATAVVQHLSPISLHLTLPPSYPSAGKPTFTIAAPWADLRHMSQLCEQLDRMWEEVACAPVLYVWADWLQNNALSILMEDNKLVLSSHLSAEDHLPRDPRALPGCMNVADTLFNIIRFDWQKQRELFVKTDHECLVCFCEFPGDQFLLLDDCGHHVCHLCMEEYCSVHVNDGTVQQLKCPEHDCEVSLPPAMIRSVLGEEAFIRWERLCLQKALDTMDDLVWCPRCNAPVVRDADETQAYCCNCCYSFCPRCREAFHAKSECATLETKMESMQKQVKQVADNLGVDVEDLMDGQQLPEDHKARISIEKLHRLKAEYMSKKYVKSHARQCPSCRAPIEKDGGCNKVHCTNCGRSMCWVCRKAISSYEHFNSADAKCALFPGQNAIREFNWLDNRPIPEGANAIERALERGQAIVIMNCPRCRQRNLRNGRNNHIKCWSCKSNMCFQCNQVIQGPFNSHYGLSMPCQQHGNN